MKAIVFANGRHTLEQRPDPQRTSADDVVVRVEWAGICGTDLSGVEGGYIRPGLIAGHEMSGVVVDSAAADDVGRAAVVDPMLPCLRCWYCGKRRENLCAEADALGFSVDGVFAEYCVVPRKQVHFVPDGLPLDIAALAEPLACTLHGLSRCAPGATDTAVILGAGAIGLLFVRALEARGITSILTETAAERREFARRVSGMSVVGTEGGDLSAQVEDMTGGRGADLVVDTAGGQMGTAVSLVRPGGEILLFATGQPTTTPVDAYRIALREIAISGAHVTHGNFPTALSMLRARPDRYAPLLGATFGLDDFELALERARSLRPGKTLLSPGRADLPDSPAPPH